MPENIELFNHAKFGQIRALEVDCEPWFVAKDICDALGYANASKAINDHVDDEDKLNNVSLSSLGQRGGWIINESGIYSLILHSRLPQAKTFKRWVTHEVLPSIRKHGAYLTPEKIEDALLNPDTIIRLATDLKDERQRRISLQEKNAQLAPRALLADTALSASGTMNLTEASRYLAQIEKSMTRKRLIELLRTDDMLCKHTLAPTRAAIDRGYMEQKMARYIDSNTGEAKTGDPYAHVTNKGLRWCAMRYCQKGEVA